MGKGQKPKYNRVKMDIKNMTAIVLALDMTMAYFGESLTSIQRHPTTHACATDIQ